MKNGIFDFSKLSSTAVGTGFCPKTVSFYLSVQRFVLPKVSFCCFLWFCETFENRWSEPPRRCDGEKLGGVEVLTRFLVKWIFSGLVQLNKIIFCQSVLFVCFALFVFQFSLLFLHEFCSLRCFTFVSQMNFRKTAFSLLMILMQKLFQLPFQQDLSDHT